MPRSRPSSASRPSALGLVEALYAGIAQPDKWLHAMQQCNTALGGLSGALVTLHRPSNSLSLDYAGILLPGIDSGFLAMQDVDPARAAIRHLSQGEIYIDHIFHGETRLSNMPFYSDFLIPAGLGNYALLPAGGDQEHLYTLSVQREVGRGTFTQDERRLMHTIQPHLSHAIALRKQLQQHEYASLMLRQTLDAIGFPLLLCSARGQTMTANRAGQTWQRQAGCPLPDSPQWVTRSVRLLLERACGLGADEPDIGSLLLPGGNVMVVIPFAPAKGTHWREALALIAIQGPDWRQPTPGALLHTLFGLTPAETRLVHHMLKHDTPLPALAEQLQVSVSTLRTQLRSIFDKTHTRRQSELIRLMDALATMKSARS